MTTNPDFTHPTKATELTAPVHELLAALPHVDPAVAAAATRIAQLLDDRDKAIEDFVNRNVVRRILVANVLGDGTLHSSLTPIDVSPLCAVSFPKAQARSLLLCTVGVSGEYVDIAPPGYIVMGVHVVGPAGYDEQFGIVRATGRTAGDTMTHAGADAVAGDCPVGPVTVTLQVHSENGGEGWQSDSGDTISLTVAEVPLP